MKWNIHLGNLAIWLVHKVAASWMLMMMLLLFLQCENSPKTEFTYIYIYLFYCLWTTDLTLAKVYHTLRDRRFDVLRRRCLWHQSNKIQTPCVQTSDTSKGRETKTRIWLWNWKRQTSAWRWNENKSLALLKEHKHTICEHIGAW